MVPPDCSESTTNMTIILVRHGETDLNRARVLQPPDTPLSALGLAQADAVARFLARRQPAAVISSDLRRAWQTAAAIAALCEVPIKALETLQERNFGELRGLPYDSLGFDPLTMAQAPAGGESEETFNTRVEVAFAATVECRRSAGGPVVVVTHGLVLRAMFTRLGNLGSGNTASAHIGNTSVTILGDKAPHPVELFNSTDHLEMLLQGASKGLVGG
jgi:broad specificity phosphatase PhoE